jgi:ribonuclease J
MKKYNNNGASRIIRQKNDRIEHSLKKFRKITDRVPAVRQKLLRITPLGGQDGIGEKNMIVVEYEHDAIILDCGFELGIDIPGINYAIPVVDYLETIKHKIRGYIISHGHMDHIGALIHVVPQFPAPIFGSQFTIGMVTAQFEKLKERDATTVTPDYHVIDMDSHQSIQLGQFQVELVRVTHAIPESSAIVVDTPVGRIINTGDFRLDPEPLDAKPSDIERLRQLGDEGVLLLMSESTNTTKLGRTPTEHTLQDSFYELMGQTKGRLVIAVFSTNMNRVQMIINAAHHYGRKVALDGRSMMTVAELAVRLGNLKIPKDVLVPMREIANIPDEQVVIICTGGQGEPGAALSRMAAGEHQIIKLHHRDSVVISSTPIPGNETSYSQIGDDLARIGVKQFRHPTHEIDGSGPLHVSGHASRDEHAEMIQLTRPQYMMPIYGGALPRLYHQGIALKQSIPKDHIIMAENGTVIELGRDKSPTIVGRVSSGSRLVDTTGAVIPEIVTKDRMQLMDDGFVVVAVTVDRSAQTITSPDIVTRGYIAMRDNPSVVDGLRLELRKTLQSTTRLRSRGDIDHLKDLLRSITTDYLFVKTTGTPIVITIVNVVSKDGSVRRIAQPIADVH